MFNKISGIMIIIIAVCFAASNIGISKVFNYPAILREDYKTVFTKYKKGGNKLRLLWMLFVISSFSLIPLSAVMSTIFKAAYSNIGMALGISAGIFYVIGLMRWVFLNDYLSRQDVSNINVKLVFNSLHIYLGNSIGETMGFISMGLWLIVVGLSIIQTNVIYNYIGIGFIIAGIGIASGPLEWLGFKKANKINKISMKLMGMCLITTGISLVV